MTAYRKDLWFSPIYSAGQKSDNILTLQERSLLKIYAVIEDMLYFTPKESPEVRRLCVPNSAQQSLRKMMLFNVHDVMAHNGRDKTYDRLTKYYWWPNMYGDNENYARSCQECCVNNARTAKAKGIISGLPIPLERWEVVHADWITNLPVSEEGYDQIVWWL